MTMKTKTSPHLATLVLLTALATLSLNMFLPSLTAIGAEFEADYATVSLSIGGYLAATAVVQLIVGPASDRIGRRPVMLAMLAVFTAASVGCALAQDIWWFLGFRTAQAVMVSGFAISLAIVRDTTEQRQAASLIGYITMAMAVAPMLGPMLGGVIDAALGWRANFVLFAIFGAALFAICWVDLGETRPDRASDQETPERLADLLKAPLFWLYAFCSASGTWAFYIFLTGVPLVAAVEFDVSAAELGFYLGTITAGFMLGGFLSGRFATRFEPRLMMLTGRLVALTGLCLGLITILSGFISPLIFFGSTIFVGVGNGLTVPSSSAATMSVHPKLSGSAAGVSGALIVGGGAVATSGVGLLLPESNPAPVLLVVMISVVLSGVIAVLIAGRLDRAETSLEDSIR